METSIHVRVEKYVRRTVEDSEFEKDLGRE